MTNTTKITTVAIRIIQLVEVGRDIYEATANNMDANKRCGYQLSSKVQLTGARYFEWGKSYQLYLVVKNFLITLDPALDFTDTHLISFWTMASKF